MKPNCDCIKQLKEQIRKHNNLSPDDNIDFRDMNLFTGCLASYVIIEQNTFTKSGKPRIKKSNVPIIHNYCAFCGKKYVD